MGVRAFAEAPQPRPKAVCPSCARPLPMLKAGKCLYCGKVLDPQAAGAEPTLSPEVLIALETGPRQVPRGRRWMIRLSAVVMAGTLLWLFAGPCMRM